MSRIILDGLYEVQERLEGLVNVIDLVSLGVYNDHNDSKELELALLVVLHDYIEFVLKNNIDRLVKHCELT